MKRQVSFAMLLLGACNGEDVCSHESLEFSSLTCRAAATFAARESLSYAPSQRELELYEDRWSRAVGAEPILLGRIPQTYRNDIGVLLVYSDNPVVVEAYSSGLLKTGYEYLDNAMAEIGAYIPPSNGIRGPGVQYFNFTVDVLVNEERLDATLRQAGAWLPDPIVEYKDDGVWRWEPDGTAVIDFSFGWGDCFSGCVGMHSVRAIVPENGDAVVYDTGGDPLPDGLHLSPHTMMLP